jgi:hypothetical protein
VRTPVSPMTAVLFCLAALPAAAATLGEPPYAFETLLEGQPPLGSASPDRFGTALSMDLGDVAIGVPGRFGGGGEEVGTVLVFRESAGTWTQWARVRPADLEGDETDRFGSAVSKLGAWLAVGTDTQFGGTRGVYVFREQAGAYVQDAHLMPPAGEPPASFGRAVAIVGDGGPGAAWLAVGAPAADAVYVYERSSGVWTFRQKLVATDAETGATFGSSLSLGSSFDLLAIGAPVQDTTGATDSGAAYVFRRTGATWAQEAKLQAPDAATGDAFGASVAHWEGTIVTGAPGDDAPGAVDRGSAHAFVYAAGSWTWQQMLAPSAGAGAAAGSAVAVNGNAALVGAPGADGSRGAAHPFARAGGTWTAGPPVTAAASDADDRFGSAVALFETRAVVGAPARFEAGTGPAGAAYAFADAGGWSEIQALVPDHGADRLRFGQDVAVEGDTAVVGASGMTTPVGHHAGGVFTFTHAASGWVQPQRLVADDAVQGDQLGQSVAVSSDTLVAGAPFKSLGGTGQQGAAYVFRRNAGTWSQEARLVPSDAVGGELFGHDVAISGDTAVVGAFNATGAFPAEGAAYVFVRSGSSWVLQQKLSAADPSFQAGFGVSVSIDGDTVVVGAHGDQMARGAAYVFRRSGTIWSQLIKLQAPDGTVQSYFGYGTALDGQTLAVGAPQAAAGAVYVFTEGAGGWAFQQKLVPKPPGANTFVGQSVALDGNRLLAGSGNNLAYVFARMGNTWVEEPTLVGKRVAASARVAVTSDWSTNTPAGIQAGTALVYRAAQADLTVTIDDGQTAAVAGAPVTYQVVARHAGGDPVAGARVTTPAPFVLTAATWTCAPSAGASCTPSGSGPLDDLASLVARASVTYTITGNVPPGQTGTLTTSARVTAPAGVVDPDPANDVAQDVDVLSRVTDLAVALGSEPTAVGAGALVTWVTDVTNLGPSDSSGAVLVHELADHATLVSVDPPPPACLASGGSVTCGLGPMAASGVRRLTVVQRADAGYLGPIVARSSVTAAETDPVSANDQRQLQVEVIPPGDAEIAHGTSLLTTVGAAGRRYRLSQRPFASYEAVVDAASGDLGDNQGPTLTLITATSTVVAASQPVGLGFSRTLRFRNDASTVVDDQYVRVASQGCTSACGADDVFRLRVYETTLYGPRFNNVGGQGTVLVLQNQGAAPVSGRAHFWSAGGTLLATAPFDLGPRGSLALATATVAGLAGQSGTLTVSHDGPYGALTGKTVALVPETGASFDTPLAYRGR